MYPTITLMLHLKSIWLGMLLFCSTGIPLNAQPAKQASVNQEQLDAKQQAIVRIAAFTARGDMLRLEQSLHTGLDQGLTISEIKEVLVQLYAYCGFPRSLNALNKLMTVVKDRNAKGINDPEGREPSPLPAERNHLLYGTANQTQLLGRPVSGELYRFAPAIDQFLKTHLFGDIFGRDNLDWKTREIATIAALASMGGVESQLQSHFGVGMHNGLTPAQLQNIVSIIQTHIGEREGMEAARVLERALAPARR